MKLNKEVSHDSFKTILNEEKKYRELKESIKMINSQRSDVAKVVWLKKIKNRY